MKPKPSHPRTDLPVHYRYTRLLIAFFVVLVCIEAVREELRARRPLAGASFRFTPSDGYFGSEPVLPSTPKLPKQSKKPQSGFDPFNKPATPQTKV
jgi:hypothetical protein